MYGSKAENLALLKGSGINVPGFMVVPSEDIKPGWEDKVNSFCEKRGGLFAVRSSCNLEDGAGQSFAGQFDTYLNVKADEVTGKVLKCMESVDSESVRNYLEEKKISPDDLKMNVVIQEMVDADKAGVLFTANPQGLLNESVIVVSRGLGEGVANGSADSTSYYFNRTDKLYYYEGKEDLLSNDEIEILIDIASKAEELLGERLDIEFAFRDGKAYVLQARPITTLKGTSPLILDNSNIVESYPGLSLPLTISFVDIVYSGVFRGVSARVLKNDKELSKHEDVFRNMVGHANGRVYYKISNWYTVLKFLPFNKKIIPVWQEMLGVKNKSYDEKSVELTAGTRFMTYLNSFYEITSVPRHMKKLEKTFASVNEYFHSQFRKDSTPEELIGLYNEIREKLLSVWDVTLLNDTYSFVYTGLVKHRLKKKSRDDAYINRYISGITNIESMKPIKALVELAYRYDEYSPEELDEKKKEYIRVYGDRNLEELKLESRTFRSHPQLLDEKIEEYRKDLKSLEEVYRNLNSEDKSVIREDPITRFLGKRCAAGIAGRERSRLNRSRIYGMVRSIFTALGEHYAKSGLIEKPDDIFWLTVDEAFDMAKNPASKAEEIRERKESYALYEQLPPYSRLIFEEKEFDKKHGSVNAYRRKEDKDTLFGIPCSSGTAEGEALVIKRIEDAKDVKDKILVTVMTDPGWVFLLTPAKGVISEKGSLLSHTAIISRELKKPSIVGVEKLTDTIKTGDIIRMDGGSGRIEIIGRK
ncbi:MAG: phosphoenolpyruvate synthase [Lachnospiraceae bacterium]|nr:phosphoenolpyruvate synthase [Lachnospiraceae bacterium]